MNANQLTQKSIEAIQSAQNLAGEKRNTQLEQAHLLYALIDDPNDLNAQLFEKIGVNLQHLKTDVMQAISGFASYSNQSDQIYPSQGLTQALNQAEAESKRMGDTYISVEHLMLGLIEKADPTLKKIFRGNGIVRDAYLSAR